MKTFLKLLISVSFAFAFFSLYITRDGDIFTPLGQGEVFLDSGTYEAFPLPKYASEMLNSN